MECNLFHAVSQEGLTFALGIATVSYQQIGSRMADQFWMLDILENRIIES